MSYVIRYGSEDTRTKASRIHRTRLSAMTAGFFLGFLLLTKLFWPDGTSMLRQILLPGNEEVTARAVTVLVEDLRAGEPVGDAVRAFCGEIIAHGNDPD